MHESPRGWAGAFARLPLEAPPAGGWQRMSRALDARRTATPTATPRRRVRAAGWVAVAAVLAVAIVLPWQWPAGTADGPRDHGALATKDAAGVDAAAAVAALQRESALLEVLVAHARDGRVATGSAIEMAAGLEASLAAIDTALARPGLDSARERALWAERVHVLQDLASFEGTRRWLAAHGEQFDGVLVQVN